MKAIVNGNVLDGIVKSIYKDDTTSLLLRSHPLKLYWIVFDEGQSLLHTWVPEENLEDDRECVVFT